MNTMLFSVLSALSLLVGAAHAYLWDIDVGTQNTLTELTYIFTVPPLPPTPLMETWVGGVNYWFFWCALETPGTTGPDPGAVIQPVLQWGEHPAGGYLDDGAWSQYTWFMVLWDVGDAGLTQSATYQSQAMTVDPGDVLLMQVILNDGYWKQTATCLSGSCSSQVITLDVPWQYLDESSASNRFMCMSELYGPQIGQWDFPVTWSDVTVVAQNSIASLCYSGGVTTDANGSGHVSLNGLSVNSDGTQCSWSSITISPP